MEKSKVIFGNVQPGKVYNKAVRSKNKYAKKFGDDSGRDYSARVVDNEYIGDILGVRNIAVGDAAEGKSEGFDAAALDYSKEEAPKDKDGIAYDYIYIKNSEKAAWNYAKGYNVNGKAMVPAKNTVYYLKEVPDGYLRPYTHYTYYKDTKKLGNLWTIDDTDDLCYSGAGFKVITDDKRAVIVESMTITTQNNSSSKVTLTAGKVFKTKGVLDGYLGYADITSYIGENTRIQQYWRTKDNIQVFGIKQRQLTFNNGVDTTITGIKATDEDYEEAS